MTASIPHSIISGMSPVPARPTQEATALSVAEPCPDAPVLCGEQWSFEVTARNSAGLSSLAPTAYSQNPVQAPPCPPMLPAITAADPVTATDGTLAGFAVQVQAPDAGGPGLKIVAIEVAAEATGAATIAVNATWVGWVVLYSAGDAYGNATELPLRSLPLLALTGSPPPCRRSCKRMPPPLSALQSPTLPLQCCAAGSGALQRGRSVLPAFGRTPPP